MGDLVPLQKPGNKRGPTANLRPKILLSTIRKILAVCLIRRIGNKINNNIPVTQAAYRPGRSTTEQVCAIKLLAEKAVTSTHYMTQTLLMDMSKAFDTIHRDMIITYLQAILNPDELHLVKVLIEDVQLTVKLNNTRGNKITTNIGTPQGDCLSPTLFTLYLVNALRGDLPITPQQHTYDHSYSLTPDYHLHPIPQEHLYCKHPGRGFLIDLQDADDISWVTGNFQNGTKHQKGVIPTSLARRNLTINKSKTEEYIINYENRDGPWKQCRYLGSLLDTDKDMERRKCLSLNAFQKIRPIFQDKKLPNILKGRIFNALVGSIFLYNSELWTMTETRKAKIDSFQRKLLR